MSPLTNRPRLALPFTVLPEPDRVRLIAGEDFRYTLAAPGLDAWLPAWLRLLDGTRPLAELLAALPEEHRAGAREVVAALYGERVLVEGSAADAAGGRAGTAAPPVTTLKQDRLDWGAALEFNRRCLAGGAPWAWLCTGALARGYVSPVFLPDAGPCLECLVRAFRRLSPAPELYDVLIAAGGAVAAVPFPAPGRAVLDHLLAWKVGLLAQERPPAAVFRLHVLETATLEVSTHRVFPDPECPACRGRR